MAEHSTSGSQPGSSGSPRWLVAALLVSLMANMVVVGVAAGRMWAHHHGHDRGHGWSEARGRGGGPMRAFLDRLPENRRAELGGMLRERREGGQADREAVRAAHAAVRAAIVSEPFDKVAFEAALERVNAARAAHRARVTAGFVDLVASMSAEERRVFAETGLKRRGHGRGGDM